MLLHPQDSGEGEEGVGKDGFLEGRERVSSPALGILRSPCRLLWFSHKIISIAIYWVRPQVHLA